MKRGDDTEEKLRTRLEEFHNKTKPVLEYYKSKVSIFFFYLHVSFISMYLYYIARFKSYNILSTIIFLITITILIFKNYFRHHQN
jgi:hypothetical protein